MDPLANQVLAFAKVALAGAAIGFLFDVYRVLRNYCRPGRFFEKACDIAFWLGVTPIALGFLLWTNWGELRLYVALGTCLGAVAYFAVLSPWVIRLLLAFVWVFSTVLNALIIGVAAGFVLPFELFHEVKIRVGGRFPSIGRGPAWGSRWALRPWRRPTSWS